MSRLSHWETGIILSAIWFLGFAIIIAVITADPLQLGQAGHERRLNECSKLVTKWDNDGCIARESYNWKIAQNEKGFWWAVLQAMNFVFILSRPETVDGAKDAGVFKGRIALKQRSRRWCGSSPP
jgi:hypothetical protein